LTGVVDGLKRKRPEWSPWLAVVEEVLKESTNERWEACVPAAPAAVQSGEPLLSGAAIALDDAGVHRLVRRLIETGSRAGTPRMKALRRARLVELDIIELFTASVRQDRQKIVSLAHRAETDPESFEAVTALVALPFLQACNRRWRATVPRTWNEGYCPVCGSWPAFAEMRGIERSRFLRCARCGGEWAAHILHCAYCRTNDHDDLATLTPEKEGSSGVIDACRRCRGYVKSFTKLQGCAATAVMLEDMASVDLDIAAIEQGYARPSGAGRAVDVAVTTRRGLFAWNL
jgi:FdhE protein